MLDLFRGDIDGQAQLIWPPQGSPSWPFTYLCYDSASLDLIDGIAINLRISRGCHDGGQRYALTYAHTGVYKYDSRMNFDEYRLGQPRNVVCYPTISW